METESEKMNNSAKIITDKEIKSFLESQGGEWVRINEFDQIVHIVDNDIFKKFQAMDYMEDDERWAAAQRMFLEKSNLKVFEAESDLDEYIEKLTKKKYG